MGRAESGSIEAALCDRFANESNVAVITDAIASIWEEIDTVLHPVIGQRGVAALFQRSLTITARTYTWLSLPDTPLQILNVAPLREELIQQPLPTVIAVSSLLLQTFYDLLAGLIGTSLAQRLLRSVSTNLFDEPTPQDIPSCPPK